MATNDLQLNPGVECPICYTLLKKPKLLSCHHTFCEGCLSSLHKSQGKGNEISCPLCRGPTVIQNGNVSNLGTNLALQSLIEDLEKRVRHCTLCKSQEKIPAVSFCADCEKFMCVSCQQKHAAWGGFAEHEIFTIDDVNTGTAAIKKKMKCNKHRSEVEDFFCATCKKYVCFRCRMLDHSVHELLEAEEHEKNRQRRITDLMAQVRDKKGELGKYSTGISDDEERIKEITQQKIQAIVEARDKAVKRINNSSEALVEECRVYERVITEKQQAIMSENDLQRACIESAGDLVSNGMVGRLDGDALLAHDTLCQELERLLDDNKVDQTRVRKIMRCALGFQFSPSDVGKFSNLGRLWQFEDWVLGIETELPVPNSMNGMAARPDGMMAVGCLTGELIYFPQMVNIANLCWKFENPQAWFSV